MVGIRFTLVGIEQTTAEIQYRWNVTLAPDHQRVRLRFLGEPPSVRSDVKIPLEEAVLYFSRMNPSIVGTYIDVYGGLNLKHEVFWFFEGSTLAARKRERQRIERENERISRRLFYLPKIVNGIGKYLGLSKWWPAGMSDPPSIPKFDVWVNWAAQSITRIVDVHVAPVLESLWRAAFAEGEAAKDLRRSGFNVELRDRTRFAGKADLGRLIRNIGEEGFTMFAEEEELGSQFVKEISY